MIARQEVPAEKGDVWSKLASPLPQNAIAWRQDGRVYMRDGKPFARFVAYVEANTVRERLDAVVPGEWDLTLDLLPPVQNLEDAAESAACAFKARLQILGVVREDVGTGKDYKQASTDAFKRAAVRFGVANELYAYETNWVLMDGDGKDARPVEDPAISYERRYGGSGQPARGRRGALALETPVATPSHAVTEATVSCPKCGGAMWDNRATKRNPRAPDYKCRDRSCDGVVWPAKNATAGAAERSLELTGTGDARPYAAIEDEIPF
jgi:hypothetical protein